MRGRPALYTSYRSEDALLDTRGKRVALGLFLIALVLLPFMLQGRSSNELNTLFAKAFMTAIGALGINIVTGYAGQLSLGHAFFLGIGAYTAAVFSGPTGGRVLGLGINEMLVWLPAAGLAAALIGALVAPVATRLRGLYLAIVTLGLVFLGEHVFRSATPITGGAGTGRASATPMLLGFRFDTDGMLFGIHVSRAQKLYLLGFIALVLMTLLAANLVRAAPGRAFAAVRDRDLAAEAMGVNLTKYKVIAFTVSSFFAGVAGALLSTTLRSINPQSYGLLESVEYLAMILIGGVATISGSLIGAAFVVLLPRLIQEVPHLLPFISGRATGGFLTVFQLETMAYGVLIVLFLILEPRGAFGLWVRVRNYFRAWPFSY